MPAEVMETPKKRSSSLRPWLFGLLGAVLLIAVAWAIFWQLAVRQSALSLDAWLAREKAFHRTWTCPDRRMTGFPFKIAIACDKPHFDGMIFGRHYSGSLNGFVATAKFSYPSDVSIKVAPPFAVVSDDKTVDFNLAWNNLDVRLGGLLQNVPHVSIVGEGFNLRGHAEQVGRLAGRARRATATFAPDATRHDHAIHFHVVLKGASVPAVDAFLRTTASADSVADGDITQASFDPGHSLAATLDQWRVAGGRVELANFSVIRADTSFQAHGTLALNSAHRLDGHLDTQCVGFEPVLRRLGVDPGLITAGSLLASLLGGGDDSKKGPQPLRLRVGFDGGRLSIGPVRTSIKLPPLY
jgi:hypothetical protein